MLFHFSKEKYYYYPAFGNNGDKKKKKKRHVKQTKTSETVTTVSLG